MRNFTWALQKHPEHTWGTPGISGWGGGDSYDRKIFWGNLTSVPFAKAAASWAEQRVFNDLAYRALVAGSVRDSASEDERAFFAKLAAEARTALDEVERVEAPHHQSSDFELLWEDVDEGGAGGGEKPPVVQIDLLGATSTGRAAGGSEVPGKPAFRLNLCRKTGAIIGLQTPNDVHGWTSAVDEDSDISLDESKKTSWGPSWSAPTRPLARLTYRTLNDTDWLPFTYSYLLDHNQEQGFCKPGSNPFSEAKLWDAKLTKVWARRPQQSGGGWEGGGFCPVVEVYCMIVSHHHITTCTRWTSSCIGEVIVNFFYARRCVRNFIGGEQLYSFSMVDKRIRVGNIV